LCPIPCFPILVVFSLRLDQWSCCKIIPKEGAIKMRNDFFLWRCHPSTSVTHDQDDCGCVRIGERDKEKDKTVGSENKTRFYKTYSDTHKFHLPNSFDLLLKVFKEPFSFC